MCDSRCLLLSICMDSVHWGLWYIDGTDHVTLWLDLIVRGATTYPAITIELKSINSRLPTPQYFIVEGLTVVTTNPLYL